MLSRIGAVFAPHNTVAASTLAALAVPPDQLAAVAACRSARGARSAITTSAATP